MDEIGERHGDRMARAAASYSLCRVPVRIRRSCRRRPAVGPAAAELDSVSMVGIDGPSVLRNGRPHRCRVGSCARPRYRPGSTHADERVPAGAGTAMLRQESHLDARQKAQRIAALFRERRQLDELPAELMPADLDEAYAIRQAFEEVEMPRRGPVAGFKIGLTTPIMQQLCGVDEPCYGAIFANE